MNPSRQAAAAYREAATLRSDQGEMPLDSALRSDLGPGHAPGRPLSATKLNTPVVRADSMPLSPPLQYAQSSHPYKDIKRSYSYTASPQSNQAPTTTYSQSLLFSNSPANAAPPALGVVTDDYTHGYVNRDGPTLAPANTGHSGYAPVPSFTPAASAPYGMGSQYSHASNGPTVPRNDPSRCVPTANSILALEAGGDSQATLVDESTAHKDKGWFSKMINAVSIFGKGWPQDTPVSSQMNVYPAHGADGYYDHHVSHTHPSKYLTADCSVSMNAFPAPNSDLNHHPQQALHGSGYGMGTYNGYSKVHPALRQYQNRQNIGPAHE